MRRRLATCVCVTLSVQRQRWFANSTSSDDSPIGGGSFTRRRSVMTFMAIQCARVFSRR